MDKLERARELGILKDGWRFIDYVRYAVPNYGWICNIRWGEKGSMKSYSMLCSGYEVFHKPDEFETIGQDEEGKPIVRAITTKWDDMEAWQNALKFTIFRPKDFAGMLAKILKEKQRLTWVGWDDINIHLPRSMYSTNRTIWENFSKNWEGFRANLSVFECTAPRKDKVVSFVLSDINWDMVVSGRKFLEPHRWFWDADFYEPEKVNKYRLDMGAEPIPKGMMPQEIWSAYWDRKMALIDESTQGFQDMLEDLDKPKAESTARGLKCPHCDKMVQNSYNLSVHIMGKHPEMALSPTIQ